LGKIDKEFDKYRTALKLMKKKSKETLPLLKNLRSHQKKIVKTLKNQLKSTQEEVRKT